jgi:hypothetical protein
MPSSGDVRTAIRGFRRRWGNRGRSAAESRIDVSRIGIRVRFPSRGGTGLPPCGRSDFQCWFSCVFASLREFLSSTSVLLNTCKVSGRAPDRPPLLRSWARYRVDLAEPRKADLRLFVDLVADPLGARPPRPGCLAGAGRRWGRHIPERGSGPWRRQRRSPPRHWGGERYGRVAPGWRRSPR